MELLFAVHSKADDSAQEVRCNIEEKVVFGRTPDSPVPIDGHGVSREHFSIQADGGQIMVMDLSANGTWINAERLTKGLAYPLKTSDLLKIPGYEIRVQLPEAPVVKAADVAPAEHAAFAPITTPVVVEPEAKKSPLDLIGRVVNSFTGLEKFIIVVDLVAICMLAWYFGS